MGYPRQNADAIVRPLERVTHCRNMAIREIVWGNGEGAGNPAGSSHAKRSNWAPSGAARFRLTW